MYAGSASQGSGSSNLSRTSIPPSSAGNGDADSPFVFGDTESEHESEHEPENESESDLESHEVGPKVKVELAPASETLNEVAQVWLFLSESEGKFLSALHVFINCKSASVLRRMLVFLNCKTCFRSIHAACLR
jgi:hypothetical protein